MEFLDPRSGRDPSTGIGLYFGEDFEGIKAAAKLQKEIRDEVIDQIKPGTTTHKLNNIALKLIKEAGAAPLFRGYGGFPDAICASVNEQIVHGTANKRKLKSGDIISLDLGVKLNGFCGDSCRTVAVGNKYKNKNDELIIITATYAFFAGLRKAKPGNTIGDIGHAIHEEILKPKNSKGSPIFDMYEKFMGHGIGHNLHEKPQVPNYGFEGHGHLIVPGMCICIEPVLIHATSKVTQTDMFTMVSDDGKTACHHENQVYISDKGPIILT